MSMFDRVRSFFSASGHVDPVLPRSVVTHDKVDELMKDTWMDEAPRLRSAIMNAPVIRPDAEEPEPIDFTSASPEEVAEWQDKARAAREAAEQGEPYDYWSDLASDLFYRLHTLREEGVKDEDEVDAKVGHHCKVMGRIERNEDFVDTRAMCRFDPLTTSMAVASMVGKLRELTSEELADQARRAQEMNEQANRANEAADRLEELRGQARDHLDAGIEPVPAELREQIVEAVKDKKAAQEQYVKLADEQAAQPFSREANEMIAEVVKAGKEAATEAKGAPTFGLGRGDEKQVDPETAMNIAERWANDPILKQIAEWLGRMKPDASYKRARRIEGGNEEIVNIEPSEPDFSRMLASEWAQFADEDLEDEFLRRYYSGELLHFEKVGEANAGRGPIGIVEDESQSMAWENDGIRHVFAKALCMTWLHIAREEKRDFFAVSFASGRQVASWEFPADKPVDPEMVLDMASHFFDGGTSPHEGVERALEIMKNKPAFSKADLVLITDGEVSVGPEDLKQRDALRDMAVRMHGVGVGRKFKYLQEMCDAVNSVTDFDLKQDEGKEVARDLAVSLN